MSEKKAYLDIETSWSGQITVIGIFRQGSSFEPLVKPKINREAILSALNGCTTIVTYNGSCFDLPLIRREQALDLKTNFKQLDLKYWCWRHNLYGGLKKVELTLGIDRGDLTGLDGRDACVLWDKYVKSANQKHLELLLRYNKADVLNMVVLEKKLSELDERA